MDIRNKIHLGTVLEYKNKIYIVSGIWFDCGGNSMVASLIKPTEYGFAFVHNIHDEEIEECKIIDSNKSDILLGLDK